MRAPSLWAAVPAFYLLVFSGLCVLLLLFNPSEPLFQIVYFAAWILWMSHVYPLMPAINDYVPATSTIVLLCLLVPGLVASVVLLKGWFRLSAVAVILLIWAFNGIGIIGKFT